MSDVLAAVLIKEPDLSKVPPEVHELLRHCLEKDPKKRLRDIGDFELLLAGREPAPSQLFGYPPVRASSAGSQPPCCWLWRRSAGCAPALL